MSIRQLYPDCFCGSPKDAPDLPGYEWIRSLPANKKIYLYFSAGWGRLDDLPLGFDIYIVIYTTEAVDTAWLAQQATRLDAQIIVLHDGNTYDLQIDKVVFVPFFYWHQFCNKINSWYPSSQQQFDRSHKFLSVCNRVTQSKLLVTCKLLELAADDSIVVLSRWVENKNVHDWRHSGSAMLDSITDTFIKKYLGRCINLDDDFVNDPRITADPWQEKLQRSAVCFTNESFHYSHMIDDLGSYIYPGPFLTEKTLKCLLGGKAIIAVGQFDTYRTLESLGLVFDYGIDLSYDQDPGNITRMEKLLVLIDDLIGMSMDQLYACTEESALYNQHWIRNGGFAKSCQAVNEIGLNKIFDLLS